MISKTSVDRVIVDTTVMPKAIAHPTDSRLLEKSHQHLVKLAQQAASSCARTTTARAPRLVAQVGALRARQTVQVRISEERDRCFRERDRRAVIGFLNGA